MKPIKFLIKNVIDLFKYCHFILKFKKLEYLELLSGWTPDRLQEMSPSRHADTPLQLCLQWAGYLISLNKRWVYHPSYHYELVSVTELANIRSVST